MGVGTIGPIALGSGGAAPIDVDKDYFLVQLVSAQALVDESRLKHVLAPASHVLVTSETSLDIGATERFKLQSLQASRALVYRAATLMAIKSNVIDLLPARMASFKLVFSFFVTSESRLSAFSDLLKNEPALRTAFGWAPAQLAAAQAISGLVGKVLSVFLKENERKPLIQFEGDFNLASGGVVPGKYVFFSNAGRPAAGLPSDSSQLRLDGDLLLHNGRPIDDLSYAVLDVTRVAARTAAASSGSAWSLLLREADDLADQASTMRLPSEESEKRRAQIRGLIQSAQRLLREDRSYHPWEAQQIVMDAISRVADKLEKAEASSATRKLGSGEESTKDWIRSLGFEPGEKFNREVADYRTFCKRADHDQS